MFQQIDGLLIFRAKRKSGFMRNIQASGLNMVAVNFSARDAPCQLLLERPRKSVAGLPFNPVAVAAN
jgi:hypothetical protein